MGCYLYDTFQAGMTKEDCEKQPGGEWRPEPGDPPEGKKKEPWEKLIMDLGKIRELIDGNVLQISVDIRNEIMTTTTVGQRVMQIYNGHFGEAVRVMRGDDQLPLRMFQAWARLLPFANQMLALKRGRAVSALRFSRRAYDLVADLCDTLAAKSSKRRFQLAVAEVKVECRRYVGLDPQEALRMCSRELPDGSFLGSTSSLPSGRRPKSDRMRTTRRKANARRR